MNTKLSNSNFCFKRCKEIFFLDGREAELHSNFIKMKNFKFLFTFGILLYGFTLFAQTDAKNRTVVPGANAREKSSVHSSETVFSNAIDKTVFVDNKKTSNNGFFMEVDPPVIEFGGVELNWSVIHQDTTIPALFESIPNIASPGNPFNIYFRESYFKDHRLYSLFTSSINLGSHFDAIDINTGQKLFNKSYNTLTDSWLEILTSILEREDGNIELTGMRTFNVVPPLFPIGFATRRVLNKDSGVNIYDQFVPNPAPDFCPCGNSNGQYGQVFPIIEDEKYLVVCLEPRDSTLLDIKIMDGEGRLQDTVRYVETLLFSDDVVINRYPQALKLPNGNIALGIVSFASPTPNSLDEARAEVILLNAIGEQINRVDITELLSYATRFAINLRDDKLYITANSLNEEQSAYDRSNLVIMSQDGGVITAISDFNKLDGESVGSIKATPFEDNKELVTGKSLEDYNCLKFFEIDSQGNTRHLKTICHSDTIWDLIPSYTVVSDGNLIVQASWQFYGEEDDLGDDRYFPVTFSIGLDQLGLTTSTADIEKTEDDIYLYPNPAKNTVYVNLPENTSGMIEVISMDGSKIISIPFNRADKVELQTGGFVPGMYLVNVRSDNQTYSSKLIISN